MRRYFLVILCFFLVTNIFPVKKDTKLILDELKILTGLVKNLEEKVTIVSTEFSTLYKKVRIIEDKVTAITKSQADTNQTKENLELSLQFIKEEINDMKNRLTKINDRISNIPMGNLPSENLGNDDQQQQQASIQSPEKIYYTAYSDYLKKNYSLAIQGFTQFINLYSQNGLADNSLYWVGECYYAQRMFQQAVNIFNELIMKYNDGDKIPAAILKKGFALVEMGKQTEGINVLKELTSRFPLSEESSLAQQKIKEIID